MNHNKLTPVRSYFRAFGVLACNLLLAGAFFAPPAGAAVAAASINLKWDANADSNLAGYRIYRSSQAGVVQSPAISGTGLLTVPSFTDATLESGTTYYYVATAVSTDGTESGPSNEVQATGGPANVAPTVTLTSPSAGSTISNGSMTFAASAADDVAIAGVRFQFDGVNIGSEATAAPYSMVWSTLLATNGVHTVTAVARDSSGATTVSAAVSVTIKNPDALTINKMGSGTGTVTSAAAGIDCGPTCSVPFTSGQVFTLVATPDAGSTFGGWSGDADCLDGHVTMTASEHCVARFDQPQSNSTSLRGDFDGDGRTDIAVYRPSTGEWLLRLSSENYVADAGNSHFQWGMTGDVPVVGDFDGDRKTDIAVYRPSTGDWFLLLSGQGYTPGAGNSHFQWGMTGDVPVVGDFDGDRQTDIAVYRPSTGEWFLLLSGQGYAPGAGNSHFQLGVASDVPVVGDFDGDGKADIAVYRPATGEWFLGLSAQAYKIDAAHASYQWGLAGDQPLAGDFDGDGKTDLSVYRPSTGEWLFRLSTQAYTMQNPALSFQWGLANDRPIVGDFDGDGKADITAFRPSTGEWFLRQSSLGYDNNAGTSHFQWGLTGDLPLPR